MYGVKDEHYDMVGSVLLKAFRQELKKEFDTETEEAWKVLYNIIANTMKP
jgi:hemoglobin-like flavoprotein